MRITGGRFRGTALAAPKSRAVRPTSDRTREAVFNILRHGPMPDLAGLAVLDLFAGTGALGFEAISRGAAFALLVDNGSESCGLVRENIERLRLSGVTAFIRRDAKHLGRLGRFRPFDLAFCDPPYGKGLGDRALAAAIDGGWLADGAIAVLEEATDADVGLPSELREIDRRAYGDTCVIFSRYEAV